MNFKMVINKICPNSTGHIIFMFSFIYSNRKNKKSVMVTMPKKLNFKSLKNYSSVETKPKVPQKPQCLLNDSFGAISNQSFSSLPSTSSVEELSNIFGYEKKKRYGSYVNHR